MKKLDYYERITSGSMTGAYHSLRVQCGEHDAAIIIRNSAAHNMPITEECYRADASLAETLSAIAEKYDMKKWGECPKSEMIMLDGPSTRWSFVFKQPYECFGFNGSQALPHNSAEALNEISDAVNKYITADNILSSGAPQPHTGESVICGACGRVVKLANFCAECGEKMTNYKPLPAGSSAILSGMAMMQQCAPMKPIEQEDKKPD